MSSRWKEYYEKTKQLPPRKLLLTALEYANKPGFALDLGSGALQNSNFLVSQGWHVTAVDNNPNAFIYQPSTYALETIISSFEELNYLENKFDLVVSLYALPFNPNETLEQVINSIINCTKIGGILCLNFFGMNDSWLGKEHILFHSQEQVKKYFIKCEVIYIGDREYDDTQKHWHVIDCIVRKI
jgi:SAM-dependent methyltransferase